MLLLILHIRGKNSVIPRRRPQSSIVASENRLGQNTANANALQGKSLNRLDRYILSQLFGPFLFFLLIFCGILWLNQAVKIIDLVVGNGQSGLVFVEISLLLLPRVLESVVAIAGFAAAVFVTNRLYGESELVIMMSAGRGPFRLAVPYVYFGVFCFLLVSAMAHLASPIANNQFGLRQFQIQQAFVAQIVQEGEFITPDDNVTLFFGFTGANGELRDVLIRERGEATTETVYTAPQGKIVQDEASAQILLLDGKIQRLSADAGTLSVIQFDSLSYDLSQFGNFGVERQVGTEAFTTTALLQSGVNGLPSSVEKESVSTINERILDALIALVAPLIGVAALLVGRFRRTGFLVRILGAVLLMVAVNALQGALVSATIKSDLAIGLIYVPVVFSVAISTLLLWIGSQSKATLPFRRKNPLQEVAS
jgi:lipopolysaccharide export system permease protein